MRRRGFLGGLLATPVVAASGVAPANISPADGIQMPLPGVPSVGVDVLTKSMSGFSDRILNSIAENQKRILALKAAKSLGLTSDEFYPSADMTVTADSMKSWSPAYKHLYENQKRNSFDYKIKRLERRLAAYKQSLFLPKEVLNELEHDL